MEIIKLFVAASLMVGFTFLLDNGGGRISWQRTSATPLEVCLSFVERLVGDFFYQLSRCDAFPSLGYLSKLLRDSLIPEGLSVNRVKYLFPIIFSRLSISDFMNIAQNETSSALNERKTM